MAMGAPILPKVLRTMVDDLFADLKAHYEMTGQRTLREAESRLIPLQQFFTGRRANAISGDVVGLHSTSTSGGVVQRHDQPAAQRAGYGLQAWARAWEGDASARDSLAQRGQTTTRIL